MYEELIRSCRACATGYVGNCDSCMFSGEDCYKQLHKASADAIEELTKDLERSKNYEMFWNKEAEEALRRLQVAVANKPRWIPVTERLPDDRRDVQITVFWHDAWRTMYGYYDGAFWHLYAPMHTEVADVEVIGWMEKPAPMPLPESQKEESNGV